MNVETRAVYYRPIVFIIGAIMLIFESSGAAQAALAFPGYSTDFTAHASRVECRPDRIDCRNGEQGPTAAGAQSTPGRLRLASAEADDDAHYIETLTLYAEAGDANAQAALGFHYFTGNRTERNIALGIQWLEKAAEHDQPEALVLLGRVYEHGIEVPRSYSRAAQLYLSAAEQGNAYAQYKIGNFYYIGLGVRGDDAKAIMWLSRAAEAGQAESYGLLAHIYFYSRRNAGESIHWWLQALAAGDEDAVKGLLLTYFLAFSSPAKYDLGGDPNNQVESAIMEMQRLSRQGDTQAQVTLAMFYRDGIGGISKDNEQARYWFQKAADAGDDSAREALAELENE